MLATDAPIPITAFASTLSPIQVRRAPPTHTSLVNRSPRHPSLLIPQSTRDATAAHQATRKHQPPRPRGQPQGRRSSATSLPPEPLGADRSPVYPLSICSPCPIQPAAGPWGHSDSVVRGPSSVARVRNLTLHCSTPTTPSAQPAAPLSLPATATMYRPLC